MRRKKKSLRKGWSDRIGRRDFLKQTGLGLAMVVAGSGSYARGEEQQAAKIVPGKIPAFVPGKLRMKWADDAIIREADKLHPFDLQGRMKMAVNAMTTCADPDLGYIGYPAIMFNTQLPCMFTELSGFVDLMGRHTDSLWMIRSATDNHCNDEIVLKITQNSMDVVDRGIAWNTAEYPAVEWWPPSWGHRPTDRWADPPEESRVILGLVTYHRATGDQRALDLARAMVRKHFEIAQKNQKYLWYPDFNYEQVGSKVLPMQRKRVNVNDPRSATGGDTKSDWPAAFNGLLLLPVMRYYDETKDSIGAELVTKFSHLVIDMMPDFVKNIGHVHSVLATISGIFRAGQVLGIREFTDWAANSYSQFTALDFVLPFGWVPNDYGVTRNKVLKGQTLGHLYGETCATVDFLELALQLAQYRDAKYWDDVECVAMNHLLEGQMLRTDFVERIPVKSITPLPKKDPRLITTDHVLQRSLGGFAINGGPNDWVQVDREAGAVTGQCCYGSGARGLYDAWYYAAQEQGDTVKVNLQFSKRLPSAVITSYMPGKATVEIEMTQGKKLRVRKPGWASAEQSRIVVDGKEKKASLAGTYFDMGYLQAGTKVRVEFPDQTVRKTERIGEVEFRTVWRGNAVVEMEPAGEIYPLYQGRNRQNGVMPLPFVNSLPVNPL
jgi:hypothetical protein